MSRVLVCLAVLLCAACGAVPSQAGACSTAAQCDSAAPFCVDGSCSATCSLNSDCTDPDQAICSAGACVQCTTSSDCTDDAASICDTASHECRGCTMDSECASGVCLESAGTCAAESDVAFVTMMGTDAGTCTKAAPCASMSFALSHRGSRSIIHVLGSTLSESPLTITGTLTFDGENTIINSAPLFTITAPATVTIEGFRLVEGNSGPPNTTPAIASTGNTTLTLYNLDIGGNGGPAISVDGGAKVTLSHSHIGNLTANDTHSIVCNNSTFDAELNSFEKMFLTNGAGSCDFTIRRNKFDSDRDGSVFNGNGGQLIMENNLIIHEMGFNDSATVSNLKSGSVIRFNTWINTTAVSSDGRALNCDATVLATSNVFAYNSMTPTGCMTRYSVFDSVATTSAGTGNQVADIDAIFVDRGARDYHPSATSVARGAAEPGQETMIKVDFDGNPRPNPPGTALDSGAFEAP